MPRPSSQAYSATSTSGSVLGASSSASASVTAVSLAGSATTSASTASASSSSVASAKRDHRLRAVLRLFTVLLVAAPLLRRLLLRGRRVVVVAGPAAGRLGGACERQRRVARPHIALSMLLVCNTLQRAISRDACLLAATLLQSGD